MFSFPPLIVIECIYAYVLIYVLLNIPWSVHVMFLVCRLDHLALDNQLVCSSPGEDRLSCLQRFSGNCYCYCPLSAQFRLLHWWYFMCELLTFQGGTISQLTLWFSGSYDSLSALFFSVPPALGTRVFVEVSFGTVLHSSFWSIVVFVVISICCKAFQHLEHWANKFCSL